jgi:hypothetical protein
MEVVREWYRPFKPLVLGSNPSALTFGVFSHSDLILSGILVLIPHFERFLDI